jgi:cytoskeletal protein CcmA (bactofilin family)
VIGSLHAPAIFIDRGVKFEGTCTMAPLDAPAGDAAAVAPTTPTGAAAATAAGDLDEATVATGR